MYVCICTYTSRGDGRRRPRGDREEPTVEEKRLKETAKELRNKKIHENTN